MGTGLWSCSSAEEQNRRQSFRGWDWVWWFCVRLRTSLHLHVPKESVLCAVGRADCPLPFSSTKVFSVVFTPFEAQNPTPGSSLGCCALVSPPWSHLLRDVWQGLVRASCIQPLVIPNIPSWLILQTLLMWEASPCSSPTRTIPWLMYSEQQGAFPGCPLSLGREGDLGSCWNYRALQRAEQSCLL